MVKVPEVALSSSATDARPMPIIGLGTASPLADATIVKAAILDAIKVGYRHFDTAALYGSEQPLGEAVAEAIKDGIIMSREELFITTKLWCNNTERDLVLPAIKQSLKNLGMDYVDLYLIHWPLKIKQDEVKIPITSQYISAIDVKSVWEAMEECQKLGLAKAIGVSNFSIKKIEEIISFAKIRPAVNQVEMSPTWQQKELNSFCKKNGIFLTAYSPFAAVGTPWGDTRILKCKVLEDIAKAREKTVAQVSLRWLVEQGVSIAVKSFNKERMMENLQIFDWSLSKEELQKISELPQSKIVTLSMLVSEPCDIAKEIDADI